MASILTKQGAELEFVAVGEDIHQSGYGQELRTEVRRVGLSDRFSFLGHRSDVPDVLRSLDILVCCSHEEPFGRCIVEAMACSLPVVATAVGGIPEVVADGETGYLVPPHRPELLAGRVCELLAKPDQQTQMGAAGHQRAVKMFSAESHAAKMLEIYKSVIR